MKKAHRKAVDRAHAPKYYGVARAFLTSAQALADLGDESDTYGNAMAILAIHAAIGYADALAVAYGGTKSTDLLQKAAAFCAWAETLYQQRPTTL